MRDLLEVLAVALTWALVGLMMGFLGLLGGIIAYDERRAADWHRKIEAARLAEMGRK